MFCAPYRNYSLLEFYNSACDPLNLCCYYVFFTKLNFLFFYVGFVSSSYTVFYVIKIYDIKNNILKSMLLCIIYLFNYYDLEMKDISEVNIWLTVSLLPEFPMPEWFVHSPTYILSTSYVCVLHKH